MTLTLKDSYRLVHDGAKALAEVEAHGVRIDLDHLQRQKDDLTAKIDALEAVLKKDKIWTNIWEEKFGAKANIGSRDQLGNIVFGELGYTTSGKTTTGRDRADKDALANIDLPFVQKFLRVELLKKALGTYLKGIEREVVDGYLHTSFNLHTTITFRSSSSNPNLQNVPIRNPEIAEIIRKCFLPRPGHQLLEVDYSGVEVRVAACYHRDPAMIAYIKDPTKDMHRDMAMECYLLDGPDAVTKMVRYVAKNMFVFPQFYGSFYIDCAKHMWVAMSSLKLETAAGVPMKKHLKSRGISRLGECDPSARPQPGTFEAHIKKVEEYFWGRRFPVYARWKKDWYNKYLEQGYVDTLTGFRIQGVYSRNQIINSPVQGSAFHCLLWSLIQLNKELKRRKMKSRIVLQIHDSMLLDVYPPELPVLLPLIREISTKRLRREWKWLIVPLDIEAELCPVDGSWFEKKGVAI